MFYVSRIPKVKNKAYQKEEITKLIIEEKVHKMCVIIVFKRFSKPQERFI